MDEKLKEIQKILALLADALDEELFGGKSEEINEIKDLIDKL
jgi:hypothetical protein